MSREAPVTIAVFCRSASSIFLLSNRLVGWCHPERWLQALIDVTGGYLKRIAIAERASAGAQPNFLRNRLSRALGSTTNASSNALRPSCRRVAGRLSRGRRADVRASRARTGGKCAPRYSHLDDLTPVIFVTTGGAQACYSAGKTAGTPFCPGVGVTSLPPLTSSTIDPSSRLSKAYASCRWMCSTPGG
jgi:hypothetical protein